MIQGFSDDDTKVSDLEEKFPFLPGFPFLFCKIWAQMKSFFSPLSHRT
jgi:hypothetical protein